MRTVRRVVALVSIAAAAVLTPGFAGHEAKASASTWSCLAIDRADFGVCLTNPLPDHLPHP